MTVEETISQNHISNPWIITETNERIISTNDIKDFSREKVVRVQTDKDRTYLFL